MKGFSSYNKVGTTPAPIKTLNRGYEIASKPPKKLESKKCFKCHVYGHFQEDCLNWKTLTIGEVEEIQAIEEATSKEKSEDEDQTLITLDVGELLEIRRALYA